jgi:antirestriction protein ArdC
MNKEEIHDEVTRLIIEELESGNVPWRKGWNAHGYLPTSMTTGKPYTGINSLILSVVANRRKYSRGLWLTYKQAVTLGGQVIKGQKGTHIVYYKMFNGKDKVTGEDITFPVMKSYVVFNLDQCENIKVPDKYLVKSEPVEVLPALEGIVAGYKNAPSIYYAEQGSAFYNPADDSITLPSLAQFETAEEHAYTLCHELTHSTGHSSRLDRWSAEADKPSKFGCESYAKEELVAELGACMILSAAGLSVDIPNSGAYIKNWLKALKDDKSLIFKASAKASKAMQHIMEAEPALEEVEA